MIISYQHYNNENVQIFEGGGGTQDGGGKSQSAPTFVWNPECCRQCNDTGPLPEYHYTAYSTTFDALTNLVLVYVGEV